MPEQDRSVEAARTASERAHEHDHPLDEAQKNYHTILEQQTARAEEDLARPASALFLSGLTAGLDLGFGPFAMVVSLTLLRDVMPMPILDLINASLYALGFVFVVMGYSALFTEQTTSAVQPVLAGRVPIGRLFRLWGIVLFANVVGGALFAGFAVVLGPALAIVELRAYGELAHKLVDDAWWVVLFSAVAAGWLMGLLSWLVTAVRDSISQIFLIWATTFIIGIASLHHSIAGTIEVLMGVFAGQGATFGDYARFLLWAVVGNALGGTVFVAALKYGHVQRSTRP